MPVVDREVLRPYWSLRRDWRTDVGGHPTKPLGSTDGAAIANERQPRAAMIPRAVPVPHDRDVVPMISHRIQREVVPLARRQRIDLERVVGTWPESCDTGDGQVDVARMEIVLAM